MIADVGYALGWSLGQRVPEPIARAAFRQGADAMWRARGKGVRRLEANLRRARPQAGDDELRALSREAVRSYLRYWCEAFRLPSWSEAEVVDRVYVEGEATLRDAHAAGGGAVVALPHMANWDHAGAWACLTGMPLTTVAERLKPERLFDRFVAYREKLGMEVLALSGGDREVFPVLVERARQGRLICLVADRDLTDAGVQVDLLGEPASLPAGPAVLSRSTGAPLIPVTLSYQRSSLRIRFHPVVEPVSGGDGPRIMTQRVADVFTAGIREHPVDWHMLQRVFVRDLEPPR